MGKRKVRTPSSRRTPPSRHRRSVSATPVLPIDVFTVEETKIEDDSGEGNDLSRSVFQSAAEVVSERIAEFNNGGQQINHQEIDMLNQEEAEKVEENIITFSKEASHCKEDKKSEESVCAETENVKSEQDAGNKGIENTEADHLEKKGEETRSEGDAKNVEVSTDKGNIDCESNTQGLAGDFITESKPSENPEHNSSCNPDENDMKIESMITSEKTEDNQAIDNAIDKADISHALVEENAMLRKEIQMLRDELASISFQMFDLEARCINLESTNSELSYTLRGYSELGTKEEIISCSEQISQFEDFLRRMVNEFSVTTPIQRDFYSSVPYFTRS